MATKTPLKSHVKVPLGLVSHCSHAESPSKVAQRQYVLTVPDTEQVTLGTLLLGSLTKHATCICVCPEGVLHFLVRSRVLAAVRISTVNSSPCCLFLKHQSSWILI